MNAIWKFPIKALQARFALNMPKGAEILSVQMQGGVPTIWASVDPHNGEIAREFAIVGTGHQEVTRYHHYLGTVQDGMFVWHVFEIIIDPEKIK